MSVVDSFYDLVERGRKGENGALSIGLPKLEEYVEGFAQGMSILIGANSGSGKTSLLLYSYIYKPIMAQDPDKDVRYIYFNLEMGEEQILAKLLSIYLYETYGERISFKEIFSRGKNHILDDEHYDLIQKSRSVLEMFASKIIFHSGALYPDQFDKIIINDLQQFGTFGENSFTPNNPKQIVGLVIDHMSLIRSRTPDKKSAMDTISNHCVTLRNMCKILSPILLMQFNRNSAGEARIKGNLQEPDTSDLKDTSTIVEDSTLVLLMFSPNQAKLASFHGYDIKKLGNRFRSIKCVKNRFGEADIAVGVGFYGEVGLFKELPKPEDISDWDLYADPNWTLQSSSGTSSEDVEHNFQFTV